MRTRRAAGGSSCRLSMSPAAPCSRRVCVASLFPLERAGAAGRPIPRRAGRCRAAARKCRRPDRRLGGRGAAAGRSPRPSGRILSPGDRGGATLLARIDNLYLGPSSGGTGPAGASQDTISGALIVTGPRGRLAAETPLRAISSLLPDRPSIRRSSNAVESRSSRRLWRRRSPAGRRGSSAFRIPGRAA